MYRKEYPLPPPQTCPNCRRKGTLHLVEEYQDPYVWTQQKIIRVYKCNYCDYEWRSG